MTAEAKQPLKREELVHKLVVRSADGKVQNALCPIELLFESRNYFDPLIPMDYESEIFTGFDNVKCNSYNASTPEVKETKRPRKTGFEPRRKRIKMQQQAFDDDDDMEINDWIDLNDGYFRYDANLNINSRPKRQRKKVSYKETDEANFRSLF